MNNFTPSISGKEKILKKGIDRWRVECYYNAYKADRNSRKLAKQNMTHKLINKNVRGERNESL